MGRLKKQLLQHFKKNPFEIPRCYYCNTELTRDRTKWPRERSYFTIDHFIPQWTGTNHSLFEMGNIKICCNECNNTRGSIGDPYLPIPQKVEMIERYLGVKGELHPDFYKYLFIHIPGYKKSMKVKV